MATKTDRVRVDPHHRATFVATKWRGLLASVLCSQDSQRTLSRYFLKEDVLTFNRASEVYVRAFALGASWQHRLRAEFPTALQTLNLYSGGLRFRFHHVYRILHFSIVVKYIRSSIYFIFKTPMSIGFPIENTCLSTRQLPRQMLAAIGLQVCRHDSSRVYRTRFQKISEDFRMLS